MTSNSDVAWWVGLGLVVMGLAGVAVAFTRKPAQADVFRSRLGVGLAAVWLSGALVAGVSSALHGQVLHAAGYGVQFLLVAAVTVTVWRGRARGPHRTQRRGRLS